EVGERSKISPSFIGQIERNETSPSMKSIMSITEALGMRLTDLLSEIEEFEYDQSSEVITPEKRKRIDNVFSGVEMYVLSSDKISGLQVLMIIARPGASTGGIFKHSGEEFAIVLSGTLW